MKRISNWVWFADLSKHGTAPGAHEGQPLFNVIYKYNLYILFIIKSILPFCSSNVREYFPLFTKDQDQQSLTILLEDKIAYRQLNWYT